MNETRQTARHKSRRKSLRVGRALIRRVAMGALVALAMPPAWLHAQVPPMINYQGRVSVGGTNFNGIGQFKFALVNSNATTTFWSNDGSSSGGSQPTTGVSLTVKQGLYAVLLGDTNLSPNMSAVPATVFTNSDVRLRAWFNDSVHGFQLLTPDQRIAAVGYTLIAAGLPNGVLTSNKIAAGAVGTLQLADNSVTASKIPP